MNCRLYSLAGIAMLLTLTLVVEAQDTARWQLTANIDPVTAGAMNATAQSLTGLLVNNYISSGGGQRLKTTDGSWPAQSHADSGRYVQFICTPTGDSSHIVREISFEASLNSSGAGHVKIVWSANGSDFSSLQDDASIVAGSVPGMLKLSGLQLPLPSGKSFYLRIYPWSTGALAPTRYLVLRNVQVSTQRTGLSSVSWALTTNQAATASGGLTATAQVLTGLSVNNYISASGGQRLKTPDGLWPAEAGPNSARHITYSLAPASGKEFFVTGISMELSFNSSGYVHAMLAWSDDDITYHTLISDTNLASGSVPVNITILDPGISVRAGRRIYIRVSPWSVNPQTVTKYLVTRNVIVSGIVQTAPIDAFPGAEGAGRYAKGGRNGSIYYVTNLNNDGAGSLRDAVSQSNRTVMFKVSGTIVLDSKLDVTKSYLTIAGQTAPGDGICISGANVGISGNHIILRYLRFRLGDVDSIPTDALSGPIATVGASSVKDIIIDHCSMSWSIDEVGTFYCLSNFTLQWCVLSESLYQSIHPNIDTSGSETHGFAGIWGGQRVSYHHNLLASNTSRNPRFSGASPSERSDLEYVDYRNNVVYNWGYKSTYGGEDGHYNMINNYYKYGPATRGSLTASSTNIKNMILDYASYSLRVSNQDTVWGGKFYIDGNYVYGFPAVTADNWGMGVQKDSYAKADSLLAAAKMTNPFPFIPVRTQLAVDAYISVLDSAGAILPRRDTIDRRIVRETSTGTATYEGAAYAALSTSLGISHPSGIIDTQGDVGGWPPLVSTTYPRDTDNDGMPNWYESKILVNDADTVGLSSNADILDGYTQIEDYLNKIESPDQQTTFVSNNAALIGHDSVAITMRINWAKDQFTYALYRSTDNVNFTMLYTIASDINRIRYDWLDSTAPHSVIYYKVGSYKAGASADTVFSQVAQVDNSLSPRYSAAIVSPEVVKGFEVLPNPAYGEVTVRHPKLESAGRIELFSASGTLVGSFSVLPGSNETRINISRLARGIYYVKLGVREAQSTARFMKM